MAILGRRRETLPIDTAVDTGDGRIAWTTHGDGMPLLLVNGYAATGADWDPMLLGKLARSFAVVCPDNRGTGRSELGAGELGVARLAEDMVAILDALEIERAAVAGWSMGGFVAQELAARHPERVDSLTLMATDPGGPLAQLGEPATLERLFDRSGTPREQATRLIGLLFPPETAAEVDAQFGEIVAEARAALSPGTLAAQQAAMSAWYAAPSEERLAAIAAPTLVMAGARDEVIPAANSTLLAERIRGARLESFPDGAHAFIAQEAPRVAGMIVDHAKRD